MPVAQAGFDGMLWRFVEMASNTDGDGVNDRENEQGKWPPEMNGGESPTKFGGESEVRGKVRRTVQ